MRSADRAPTMAPAYVKRTLVALATSLFLAGSAGPALTAGPSSTQSGEKVQVKTVVIPVQGMACVACAATVKRTLKALEGVSQVEASLERRAAQVSYVPEKVSADRLVAAINQAGYRAGVPREQN
jgi:copper chaperone CopZ